MAIYRTVSLSFWTDPKIEDDFTPEDRYFYLYLFTNPHTNLAGCYEISIKQMARETGYGKETIERLLERFINTHHVIDYSEDTKEVLLINWHKYNWTKSEKFRKALATEIQTVENDRFRQYLSQIFNDNDVRYRMDTNCINTNCIDTSVTVTVSDTVPVSVSDSVSVSDKYIDVINKSINEHNYSPYLSKVLTDWFLYKREKGNSYKPIGLSRLLNKVDSVLQEHDEQKLCEIIEKSMENNYQGIVWDWLDKKNNQTSGSAYMDAIKNRVSVVDDWV